MSELDREMLRYLRAYRSETRPPAAQRDGALEGLMHRVRTGDDVEIDEEPTGERRVALPMRGLLVAASLAAMVTAGSLVVGERLVDDRSPSTGSAAPYEGVVPAPSHEIVEVAPPEAAPSARPIASTPAVEVAPTSVAEEPPRAVPRRTRARSTPEPELSAAPTVVEPSIDAAEVAALRRAQAELSRAPADALAHLADHAATYPDSSFAAERDVARATALCKLGRDDEARALAAAFEERRPDSPLLSRMRRICKESRAIADGSSESSH